MFLENYWYCAALPHEVDAAHGTRYREPTHTRKVLLHANPAVSSTPLLSQFLQEGTENAHHAFEADLRYLVIS